VDFYAEQEKRKNKALTEIAQLIDEYYQLSHHVESSQKRMAEIDKLVAERDSRIKEIEQSQRNFDSYMAVKEGAVTLEDIKNGVEAAGKQ